MRQAWLAFERGLSPAYPGTVSAGSGYALADTHLEAEYVQ